MRHDALLVLLILVILAHARISSTLYCCFSPSFLHLLLYYLENDDFRGEGKRVENPSPETHSDAWPRTHQQSEWRIFFRFAFTLLWLIHRWIDAVVKEWRFLTQIYVEYTRAREGLPSLEMLLQEVLHGPIECKAVFLVAETMPFVVLDHIFHSNAAST